MTRPESVLVMHKSYFCLYQLRDFKRAITVAVDHFKNCEDGDLILMVAMDILSKQLINYPSTSFDDVQRTCLDLLASKSLVGLQRILLRCDCDALAARHKDATAACKCLRHSPVRSLTEMSHARSLKGATKGNRANLSHQRLPMISKTLATMRRCREEASESTGANGIRGKRRRGPNGAHEAAQHLKINLVECYGDKNLLYYQIDGLTSTPIKSDRNELASVSSGDLSMSNTSPLMSSRSCSAIREHYSNIKFYTQSSLRRISAQLCLEDEKAGQMEWWRRHFRLIKRKIFQVCNMLFININVPFIAVDLFSRLFQNLLATTTAGVRRSLSYMFNCAGHTEMPEVDQQNKDKLTEDEITMLFLLAANCLEIALKCHNAHARFDFFSLFYFLVFIDSILTKVDMQKPLAEILPALLSIVDMKVVLHQKLNYGRQYLKRSLKYHHNLFRRKLDHLSNELKKNRVLQIVGFKLMNCVEQLLLLSHGIFGFSLTFRIAPVIIETTSGAIYGINTKRSRYEYHDYRVTTTSKSTMFEYPPFRSDNGGEIVTEAWSDCESICMDQRDIRHPTVKRMRSPDNRSHKRCETATQTYRGAMEPLGVATLLKQLSSAPNSELDRVNTFLTESTEMSILLLHMLSCSDYIEILSGNTIFTEPGANVNSSSLMAALALRFVLDVFIVITDDTIAKMLECGNNRGAMLLNEATNSDCIEAFKNYFDEYYYMVDANNCVFYFLILEIDWILHKEHLYSEGDYMKHQQLLNRVIYHNSPVEQNRTDDVFDMHYRLYEKIALLMFGEKSNDPRTAQCVEAFKSRSMSWSKFDEIVVRSVRPEDEMSINNEIMDLYYSDIKQMKTSFNPYKSIFTPKYFCVAKDLVYRVKASLMLYYISQRCGDMPS